MSEESSTTEPQQTCPKCQGPMWDNREGKRNPRAPDFKCKDRGCEGVIWPPREAARVGAPAAASPSGETTLPAKAGGGVDSEGMPLCPICGGAMWDDRQSKRNPRAPDFKCKNKPRERGGAGCEGIIWPPREGTSSPYPAGQPRAPRSPSVPSLDREPVQGDQPPLHDGPPPDYDDDLPF